MKASAKAGYLNDLRQLCLYLHNPELEDIRWEHILDITEQMKELGWDSNTFVRKFISYRKFFDFWHKQNSKVLDPEWIPKQRKEYRRPRVATEDQYQKLLDAIKMKGQYSHTNIRNLAILNMWWDTGVRIGELVSLNVSDLNVENKTAIIETEKNRGTRPLRQIFWTNTTNESLKAWLRARTQLSELKGFFDTEALFLVLNGKDLGKRISTSGLNQMLGVLCDKAQMPRVNAHSFRHHMGHDIIKKGGSNSDVSNILGHADLASSYIYTQMSGPELAERYRRFKGE